jgi:hypothetical protein
LLAKAKTRRLVAETTEDFGSVLAVAAAVKLVVISKFLPNHEIALEFIINAQAVKHLLPFFQP